jgi:GNAT superfamily N-acetyltransferase
MTAEANGLLHLYHAQMRAHVSDLLPQGVTVERDGPLVRTIVPHRQGWVEYRNLGDPSEEELDQLISAQIARFAERGEAFEWKFHTHDRPAFLETRLLAAGFRAGELETVMIAEVAALAPEGRPPIGVVLRQVFDRTEFERIAAMESAVSGREEGWLTDALEQEHAADPTGMAVVLAEADGVVVSAGWMRFPSGTDFATLWGGATLPGWRGRGVYRALVLHRARLALERGRRYLQVDASAASRPILERLGFLPVTQTRPYVWSPRPVNRRTALT